MLVKGKPAIAGKKISYLQGVFKLSAKDALALKKGREIEVDNADALLQAGFVSIKATPKLETKPKSIKVSVEKKIETKPRNPVIAPNEKGEEE